ncbi:MAG: bis(5'-nucleosyl)-tetraphosphatase (symmetrical) YqeK [Clostridiales bacterium]|nr:bis(5'-nucleosyl)-tetraphosphatase (symmetrical) YqeK [Clostridiales bacterium]
MDCIEEYIEKNFSEKRKKHTYDVCKTAKALARHYGADEDKAGTAALFHDMFRGMPDRILNFYVRHLDMDKKYLDNSNLAHGKLAALIMERDYGISDDDVLNAVRYHTTGRAHMSELEKIMYLADAIEPGRDYPGVKEIRNMAYQDLDQAVLLSMHSTLKYIRGNGFFLDEDTLSAIDYLDKKGGYNGQ